MIKSEIPKEGVPNGQPENKSCQSDTPEQSLGWRRHLLNIC